MAKFGDLFEKDGTVYRITNVPTKSADTYSIEPLHRKVEDILKKGVVVAQHFFLAPGGEKIHGVKEAELGNIVSTGTAVSLAGDPQVVEEVVPEVPKKKKK